MEVYQIVDKRQAEAHGFTLEGYMGLLYDLGCTMAVMSYNSLEKAWQFDTGVDGDCDTWQFLEPDLDRAKAKAEEAAKLVQAFTRIQVLKGVDTEDIEFVGLLDVAFQGCAGVTRSSHRLEERS